jgi:hypothetical protein
MRWTLPAWAEELAGSCLQYTFTTMRIHDGRRAVVAAKSGDGSGPLLVVTTDEGEMRAALGLKPREQADRDRGRS